MNTLRFSIISFLCFFFLRALGFHPLSSLILSFESRVLPTVVSHANEPRRQNLEPWGPILSCEWDSLVEREGIKLPWNNILHWQDNETIRSHLQLVCQSNCSNTGTTCKLHSWKYLELMAIKWSKGHSSKRPKVRVPDVSGTLVVFGTSLPSCWLPHLISWDLTWVFHSKFQGYDYRQPSVVVGCSGHEVCSALY